MWSGPPEGSEIVNVVFHFVVCESTLKELKRQRDDADGQGGNTTSAAAKLLQQWCAVAPNDRNFMGRFKVRPHLVPSPLLLFA